MGGLKPKKNLFGRFKTQKKTCLGVLKPISQTLLLGGLKPKKNPPSARLKKLPRGVWISKPSEDLRPLIVQDSKPEKNLQPDQPPARASAREPRPSALRPRLKTPHGSPSSFASLPSQVQNPPNRFLGGLKPKKNLFGRFKTPKKTVWGF